MNSSLRQKNVKISREDLYEQVWATPVNQLANEFGVSGSYLARVCEALNVPRPPVGYWQKKAVGKAEPRPDLPPSLLGDQVTWSKNEALAAPVKKAPQPPSVHTGTSEAKFARTRCHPLLQGVEKNFCKTRKFNKGEFLKPYKYLLPDIVTSEASLDQALEIANKIYNAFEDRKHRVILASNQNMHRLAIEEREDPGKDRTYGRYFAVRIWSPCRPTITYIGAVPVGLALTEMTEKIPLRKTSNNGDIKKSRLEKPWEIDNSWKMEQDFPCGRFRLVAYSPFSDVNWMQSWQETAKTPLLGMISSIISELEGEGPKIHKLMIAAEERAAQRQREWQQEQEDWRREENNRRLEQAHAQSQKQLLNIMDKWAKSLAIKRFFSEAEERAALAEPERSARLMDRLALAKSMLASSDPLDYLEEWPSPQECYTSTFGQKQ